MKQGVFGSIIAYAEHLIYALIGYFEQGNPMMEDKDIMIDFFDRFDNARQGRFKVEIINRLTCRAIKHPDNLLAD